MNTRTKNTRPSTQSAATHSRLWTTSAILLLTLEATALSSRAGSYEDWIAPYGVTDSAMQADPDRDGASNLLEFVLGGDPSLADAAAYPAGILPRASVTSSDLVLEFERSEVAKSIDSRLLYGSALAAGSELPLTSDELTLHPDGVLIAVDPGNPASQPDTITVAIPLARAVEGRVFARVRATVP